MSSFKQVYAIAFATLFISAHSLAQEAQNIEISIKQKGQVRTFQLPVFPSKEVLVDERVVVPSKMKGQCNFVLAAPKVPFTTGVYFRGRANAGANQARVAIEYSNQELVGWNAMDAGPNCTIEMPKGTRIADADQAEHEFLVKKGASPITVWRSANNEAELHNIEVTAVWN